MSADKNILVTSPLIPPLEEFIPYLQQIWDKKWIVVAAGIIGGII